MIIDDLASGRYEFELSVWQRLFYTWERNICHVLLRRPPPVFPGQNLLNLGCGPHIYEGWVNADDYAIKRWLRQHEFRPNWRLDISRPWDCPDNHWDGIFTEHVVDMMTYSQAISTFRECLRTLKQGAWLRVSLPDFRKYMSAYEGKDESIRFRKLPHRILAISDLAHMHLKKTIWEGDLLEKVLSELGFINVKEVSFREGCDVRLLCDDVEKASVSFYVEGRKPSA